MFVQTKKRSLSNPPAAERFSIGLSFARAVEGVFTFKLSLTSLPTPSTPAGIDTPSRENETNRARGLRITKPSASFGVPPDPRPYILEAAILIILMLVVLSVPARAEWTTADTYRQLAITALLAADYGQTLNTAVTNPPNLCHAGSACTAGTVYRENNPLLGQHPSKGTIEGYFIGSAILSAGISYVLSDRYRALYQYFYIGFESAIVYRNYTVGMEVKF